MTDDTRAPRSNCLAAWLAGSLTAGALLAGGPAVAQDQQGQQQDDTSPRRVALVIGNGDYEFASRLANPVNDAADVAASLEALGWQVLDGYDLEFGEMQGVVRDFAREIQSADDALFFYAGHALQVDGRNYMMPTDAALADTASVDFETIDMNLVISQVSRAAGTKLILLDACRDNPLADNLARDMAAARAAAVGQGLAQLDTIATNTLIAYATQPGATASDGFGRNSPFTGALLQHLETPGLDVQDMLRRVRASVMLDTNDLQVPWDNSSLTDEFFFVPSDAPPPSAEVWQPPVRDPSARQLEVALWDDVKDTGDAGQIQTYLDAHPDGAFASTARARIRALEEAATADARAAEEMADAIAARFAELAGRGALVAEPQSAAEFYANARLYEVQGDAVNAAAMYEQYFAFGEPYVDPHLRHVSLLEIRQGLPRARETYNRLVAANPEDAMARFARILLQDRDVRIAQLTAFMDENADFAPGWYALAEQYATRVVGSQTTANQRAEKAALDAFIAGHERGDVLRWFLDQELAAEQLADARQRLAMIANFSRRLENPVQLMKAGQSDTDLLFALIFSETIQEAFISVDGAPFRSLGFLAGTIPDPVTGKPMAERNFSTSATLEPLAIDVKYIDADGVEQGPFALSFAPVSENLAAAKNGLYTVWPDQWLLVQPLREGQTQVVHAILQWHACSIEKVMIGVETETPDTALPMIPCTPDVQPGYDTGNQGLFRVDRDIAWMTAQITFKDGEVSPIRRFAPEVEEDAPEPEIPSMTFPQ